MYILLVAPPRPMLRRDAVADVNNNNQQTNKMNHHTNRMRLIKQRKETELIRLMSQKTALSPADTEKVFGLDS
jgi:hypothetical protein